MHDIFAVLEIAREGEEANYPSVFLSLFAC